MKKNLNLFKDRSFKSIINLKNNNSALLLIIIGCILAALSFGIFIAVNNILVKSNIDTMSELAIHDSFALNTIIEDEWKNMEVLPSMLKGNPVQSEKELVNTLRVFNEHYSNSITMLVDDHGVCCRSDGVIKENSELSASVSPYQKDFVLRYDEAFREVPEANKESIIFGKRIQDTVIDGHTFTHMLRVVSIKEMDNKLKLESFDGEGHAGVIDQDGYFVIKTNRSGNVAERENFFEKLEDAKLKEGLSLEKILENVQNSPDGIAFETYIDDIDTGVYIVKVENTNWYYVSQVPMRVFSSVTNRILGLVVALLIFIIFIVMFFIQFIMKNERKRLTEAKEHQEQLSEALEMAEKASRSKTTFLNNMSHDIRTPMNAIIGFTALAQKNISNSDMVLDHLKKIAQSSDHLLSLINDILDMSRIESGKVTIDEKEENLFEIIHSIHSILQADINAKDLVFSIDNMDVHNEYIICDKLRINQILLNIISNAVKYTPNGGRISLKIIQEELMSDGRCCYEFRVEDNGIGMSEEYLETIFEAFTRERTSTISGIQGTGLGMAITKNIVDMMDGTITCTSKQGEGTEFIVRLPLRIQEDGVEEQVDEVKEEKWTDLRGKRILLVEDNELNQEIAVAILQEEEMLVDVVNNGQDACTRLLEEGGGHYDLVLMDIQMPVMNGYDAARAIRTFNDEALSKIPIFAMTADAFEEDKKKAFEAGMNGHISKPINISVLLEEISKALS